MLTTTETAQILGVSTRRVVELIHNGSLHAQKHGGIWLVSEVDVKMRVRTVSEHGGRPTRGKGRNDLRFILMNRQFQIAEVVYDRKRREFTAIGDVADASRAPVGIGYKGAISLVDFNDWWRNRGIPGTRDGIERLLEEAGADVPEELIWKNLGLSLTDQYWIRPDDVGLSWDDINFFTNDWGASSILTPPYTPDIRAVVHPDNTSNGNLSKHWVQRAGKSVLQKYGGHNSQEPFNEVVSTALHTRLLKEGEFVRYELSEAEGTPVSECANFLTSEEEFIPAHYIRKTLPERAELNDFEHYVECCRALGVHGSEIMLSKMIVCDDVIANHDRHWRNFGVIRNITTLQCRPAPLFDSGSSLWCNRTLEALQIEEHSFTAKPFYDSPARQLLLVEDFSWADPHSLDGFAKEAMSILEANPMITERLPFIQAALEWRVRRMVDVIEWS